MEDGGVKADLGWMILEISSPRRGFCTKGLLYSGLGPGSGWIWVGWVSVFRRPDEVLNFMSVFF